ncbi:hypothetical protein, variant [Fonticula alba]|uniref:U2A'/phosphoprotein 32 family A C-terminal domain-containing protein n=1 Tax=Fonticula alba TaxID=691883 RepID=A0A058Z840_FONAL|nr:hypothetical protein H696_02776 [Fonticula alba]XP_009494951.1 hypothetical protein, variant [Fonticula alba]KCV70434.1 hypothetical protein H696_02776 [Fonticula alba]KCV70435.1 hypothetical protein, variant [Fonticula alba]|eukprot:XP_009494950.1 hypothetical protein H696_02776 [Fonticula alba]
MATTFSPPVGQHEDHPMPPLAVTDGGTSLSCAGRDWSTLPEDLEAQVGVPLASIRNLDLSFNNLSSLDEVFALFPNLETLIADNNQIEILTDAAQVVVPEKASTTPEADTASISSIESSDAQAPVADSPPAETAGRLAPLASLKVLSLNNNNLAGLEALLDALAFLTPNLNMLSLARNPVCPDGLFREGAGSSNERTYRHYRLRVIFRLPGLAFLDASRIAPSEREVAQTTGQYLRVATVGSSSTAPNTAASSSGSFTTSSISSYPTSSARTTSSGGSAPGREYAPLPETTAPTGTGKARYGVSRYVYKGNHSEGNRFICNQDL